jgi:hypothetical protein
MKSKANIFGYNEELSEGNKLVFEKKLEDGVIAEANNDGTIFVSPGVSIAKKKEEVAHEDIHLKQMAQGRLGYSDNEVFWKPDTKTGARVYKRDKGNLIAMDGSGSDKEGGDFPWEDEAYKNS